MYTIISQGNKIMPYITEFVVNNKEEIKEINIDTISPGSTCIVTDDSSVYMLNIDKEWKLL